MTMRLKTTKWAFDMRTTSLAASTVHTFPAITVYAETASRTIRSAVIRYAFYFDQTGAANLTNRQGGVQIDAVAAQDNGVAGTVANTGDHEAIICSEDLTDYFVTNFTGASHSVVARWRQVGCAASNLSAELILTYEYDDAGLTTAYKTVEIPIESPTARLTDTLAEIGVDQVPQLTGAGGLLPEAGVTIRDVFFRIEGNLASDALTNFSLGIHLDAESEVLFGEFRQNVITSVFWRGLWKRADIAPGSAHSFSARSTVASRFEHLTVTMVVTYEYNPSTTTRVLNSLRLPLPAVGTLGGPTSSDPSRQSVTFQIQEPGTITLVQSGVVAYYSHSGLPTGLAVRAGGQAFRSYDKIALTDVAGNFCLAQRIDSGGAQGAGLTLARGANTLNIDAYRTSTAANTLPVGWMAVALVNYTSDVAAAGDGAHNHTVEVGIIDNLALAAPEQVSGAAVALAIPESAYWLNSLGCELFVQSSTNITLGARVNVGSGAGFVEVLMVPAQPNETSTLIGYGEATSAFRRWPQDPLAGRIDPEAAYEWRTLAQGSTQHWPNLAALVTYHAIAYSQAVALVDYAGDGSGVVVDLHRADNDALAATVTTAIGGTATATLYDDTVSYYAHARQDATHVGRSDDAAVGS
ncbi:MAG: hypothetical protein IPG45_05975 [Deltaproteobacteria bacterium]|nr:hypothetical protein [Deltaproteobacteria bacterium]